MLRIDDDSMLIHYELSDSSTHIMSAKVEAESSLQYIKAMNYISKVLCVENELQTGALSQGSVVKVFWLSINKGEDTKWIRYIITIIFRSLFFEKKIIRLDDFTKLLDAHEADKVRDVLTQMAIDKKIINRLNSHLSIKKARSEYFKQLLTDKGIKAISIKHNDFDNLDMADVRIESSRFADFIETFEPETKVIEHAQVFIVSPVIVKGKAIKWNGSYKGQDIKFEMMSNQFKTEAQNAEIDFRTGFYIDSRLQFDETVDEDEKIIRNNFKVLEVYGHGYDENFVETPAGKKKRLEDNLPTLFDGMEDW